MSSIGRHFEEARGAAVLMINAGAGSADLDSKMRSETPAS